jgi:DNA (cytosine-5)-methyltransferase 1
MAHKWPARPNEGQHDYEPPRVLAERVSNRRNRIKALGNAVVPQVVYPIALQIRKVLEA